MQSNAIRRLYPCAQLALKRHVYFGNMNNLFLPHGNVCRAGSKGGGASGRPYDTSGSELSATIPSGTARGFTLWLCLYVTFHRYWGREIFQPQRAGVLTIPGSFSFHRGSQTNLPLWDLLHAPSPKPPILLFPPAAVFCQSGPIQGFAVSLTVAPLR